VDKLWAPWRMKYVAGPRDGECLFCALAGQKPAPQNLLLWKTGRCLVMLNAYPYNNGHMMVAPVAHVAGLADLPEDVLREVTTLTRDATVVLDRVYKPAGFNVGMNLGCVAGAGIAGHLHMHVVPRWEGDNNFMPVIGETRVLPEDLEETYGRVAEAARQLGFIR